MWTVDMTRVDSPITHLYLDTLKYLSVTPFTLCFTNTHDAHKSESGREIQ